MSQNQICLNLNHRLTPTKSQNSQTLLGAVHKVRHTSRTPPPIFSRPNTKIPDKSPLYKFYLNCSQRFLSGWFCPGWFLSVPPCVAIHLLQQKVKHHFKFHVSYV